MKIIIWLGIILLPTTQLYAETYSWIDDNGTYNFTENYSSIPKKYRKKVKRRDDLPQDLKPQQSLAPGSVPKQTEKKDAKPAVDPEGEKDLYGGKSRAVWRKELNDQEAELSSIEQRMERLREQIINTKGLPEKQLDLLKKDYNDSRAIYDQKYKNYIELIETVRKAGIPVEIKK